MNQTYGGCFLKFIRTKTGGEAYYILRKLKVGFYETGFNRTL